MPRFKIVLLMAILGILYPGMAAEFLLLGYGLNESLVAAGTVCVVTAEVTRRFFGDHDDGGPQGLLA